MKFEKSSIKTTQIGEGTSIGDFCVIDEEVVLGRNCRIFNNVTITGRTTIGDGTIIFPNAVLGTAPQDLKYRGEKTELIIGRNNRIREFCMFNPGTGEGGRTIIGDGNLFMAFVHIAHDCVVGSDCVFANGATLGGHIVVGNSVTIGGLTALHQFVQIGDGTMLAGASAVSQDIPPFCLAEGNRAVLRGLNKHRLRKMFEKSEIDALSRAYRALFSGAKPLKEMADEILAAAECESVRYLCRFILESKRGIPFKRGAAGESED